MKIAFHTLGCKLNFAETSFIANNVKKEGFNEVEFNEFADIYVINTCSVTENANKECNYLIRKVLKQNPKAKTVIMGCYAQLKPNEISKIHGVDLVIGNNSKFELNKHIHNIKNQLETKIIHKEIEEINDFKSAFSYGSRTRSFLKIQDGCNYKCTFCTIPLARGKNRSDNILSIINKINELKNSGIKEVVLTGVNIGDFKTDKNEHFIDLLHEIETLKDIRVRISSIEPNLISNDIIQKVKNSKILVPHFHIPLQSGSDTILKSMKRRYLTKYYKDLILKINANIKNVCIGADVIVGFPGETEDLFNETLNFIKSIDISYLHVFTYSERMNTEAIKMNNHVSIEKRKYRSKVLRNLSEKKKLAFYQKQIGSVKEVLFENETKDGYIFGFSENYIKIKTKHQPDITNKLKKIKINKLVHDHITYASGEII
ncbi:MAG: tRNA (N(6)-L-threonylcarbamoyladenosine(37)-C(2))-methylthiotransferase MtaB [Flavobacteriales bacterium]|nr:tRNA (N(6)-L-threonylcarbamoyladenosine(37)-C(2))-methylthiotransferase MtaB [Flavobacteriales bacterium]|tara:strand:+ start:11223 stop:12512 length:1290 start_codon:yes stop_codon:yes gene_type:complete